MLSHQSSECCDDSQKGNFCFLWSMMSAREYTLDHERCLSCMLEEKPISVRIAFAYATHGGGQIL